MCCCKSAQSIRAKCHCGPWKERNKRATVISRAMWLWCWPNHWVANLEIWHRLSWSGCLRPFGSREPRSQAQDSSIFICPQQLTIRSSMMCARHRKTMVVAASARASACCWNLSRPIPPDPYTSVTGVVRRMVTPWHGFCEPRVMTLRASTTLTTRGGRWIFWR